MSCIADASMVFRNANSFLTDEGKLPAFEVLLVSNKKSVSLCNGSFEVHTDTLISQLHQTDLIIIPAITGENDSIFQQNSFYESWISKQYSKGTELISMNGKNVFQTLGLLHNKKPLTENMIVVKNGLYYTNGTYWNLLIHLIEKYTNNDIAGKIAKMYAVTFYQNVQQASFINTNNSSSHQDQTIREAQEYIEKNVGERITVEELSLRFAIGRRHFIRRFKKATDHTPLEFIQKTKIDAARKMLETTDMNITEVMYEVGYNDLKTFRTTFKKLTGKLPVHYRMRYNKTASPRKPVMLQGQCCFNEVRTNSCY